MSYVSFCLQHIIFAKGDTLGCESMSEAWPSRGFNLNGIPRSLYTRPVTGINSLWITVSFCSFPQLHMVFDGPGEELAVVALWIKVHPVYFSGYFSLFPSNDQYVNKSRRSFAFLYLNKLASNKNCFKESIFFYNKMWFIWPSEKKIIILHG